MRILCTTVPRHGHLQPRVPIARAAGAAGHAVAVACAASVTPVGEQADLRAVAAGFARSGTGASW
jgi:UDP:flavonoid glycosyltransferase YjiC (YdhE family)